MKLRTLTGWSLAAILAASAWAGHLPTVVGQVADNITSAVGSVITEATSTNDDDADALVDRVLTGEVARLELPEDIAEDERYQRVFALAGEVERLQTERAEALCDAHNVGFPDAEPCEVRVLTPAEVAAELAVLNDALGIETTDAPMTPAEQAEMWAQFDQILGTDR